MKEAILIQCHKNAKQVNMLLNALEHPNVDIYIHVDKTSNIDKELESNSHIFVIPENLRVDVQWATFSQVTATLNLMHYASQHGDYQHYWLCSGQDYPIKPINDIVDFLKLHPDMNFIQIWPSFNYKTGVENNLDKRTSIYFPTCVLGKGNAKRVLKRALVEITGGYNRTFALFRRKVPYDVKFYFGSNWVCLSNEMESWMENYLETHSEYIEFFKNVNCADESFFQTLVMNSPYKNKKSDFLHYVDWTQGKNNPKVLCLEDLNKLETSNKLMARKFDLDIDDKIMNAINNYNSTKFKKG